MTNQKQCRRCGTCCRKGGPVLRREDSDLVRLGHIPKHRLLTIRAGEFGHNPASGRFEPVPVELVKICGRSGEWTCCFLDEEHNTCGIYQHRPSTCRILECWQPEALLATIYQETLSRSDLLAPDDLIREEIGRHEEACPGWKFSESLVAAGRGEERLEQLAELVRTDLALRDRIVRLYGLSVAMELFLFGRPFFRQLAGFGLEYQEKTGEIRLYRSGER